MAEIIVRKAKREDCKAIRALIQVNFVDTVDEYKSRFYTKVFFIRNWQIMRRCQMDQRLIIRVRFYTIFYPKLLEDNEYIMI